MQPIETYKPKCENTTAARFAEGFVSLLASVKFAVTLVVLIALACAVGTLVPQGPEKAAELAARSRNFADWLPTLTKLGVTNLFYSGWFVTLLGFLAASIAACSSRRFSTIGRASGYVRRRAIGSMLTHISLLLILAGGIVRGTVGQKGRLELRTAESTSHFNTERGLAPLPFTIVLNKFELIHDGPAAPESNVPANFKIQVHWPEKQLSAEIGTPLNAWQTLTMPNPEPGENTTVHFRILQYLPDFIKDGKTGEAKSISPFPHNPAVLLEANGPAFTNVTWLFGKHPGMTMEFARNSEVGRSPLKWVYAHEESNDLRAAGAIANYRSTVTVSETAGKKTTASLEVNKPFRYKGYSFYQSGYNPEDLSWSSMQVVKDPGVPLVYAGFLLIVAGLFTVFYLNPWLDKRKGEA